MPYALCHDALRDQAGKALSTNKRTVAQPLRLATTWQHYD